MFPTYIRLLDRIHHIGPLYCMLKMVPIIKKAVANMGVPPIPNTRNVKKVLRTTECHWTAYACSHYTVM